MFDYLQQFNNLPKNLRDQVSSPSAMALISELEVKYKVDLAIVVMKIMIKSLSIANLPVYLSGELSLSPDISAQLTRDLKEKLFAPLAAYLGLVSEIRALDIDKDIDVIIKEAGLALPSAVAISRFKTILSTYVRGIRTKIDTRNTLSKDVKIGGLNLSPEEIDRVLKICDTRISKASAAPAPSAPADATAATLRRPADRLDKIISGAEKSAVPAASEYNLKESLSKGSTKPVAPMPLDTKHELAKPAEQLDLPRPGTPAAPIAPVAPVVAPIKPISNPKIINPVTRPASHLEPIRPSVPGAPKLAQVAQAAQVAPAAAAATAVRATVPRVAPISVSPAAARNLAGKQAPAPSAVRPQMHDIKPMPKVMGPIEELQFLDIVNFRRLGATPAETTAKVFAKIKLLEKDGYDKMVAGVRAWRQSPVSRLYLRLGQEAIAKGQPMKAIADARKAANQEYLSMDEIEAIVSLNSKLVF